MASPEERTKATANEKIFKEYFVSKFGVNSLNGKQNYKDDDFGVSISVDESFKTTKKAVLIEIDSGNMAKLLVGQYLLINELSEMPTETTIFVVVHFYKNYNPERTKKNLDFVNNLYNGSAIPHCSLTFDEFKIICEKCISTNDLEESLTKLTIN